LTAAIVVLVLKCLPLYELNKMEVPEKPATE
jgi:hypothetical protein